MKVIPVDPSSFTVSGQMMITHQIQKEELHPVSNFYPIAKQFILLAPIVVLPDQKILDFYLLAEKKMVCSVGATLIGVSNFMKIYAIISAIWKKNLQ